MRLYDISNAKLTLGKLMLDSRHEVHERNSYCLICGEKTWVKDFWTSACICSPKCQQVFDEKCIVAGYF